MRASSHTFTILVKSKRSSPAAACSTNQSALSFLTVSLRPNWGRPDSAAIELSHGIHDYDDDSV